jgi:type II secretory pathway pseudopilin PulG
VKAGGAVSAQRGFAMIAILALVALIAAFLIASSLNRTAADVSNDREDRSMSALRKAKAALIAHAANEQWQLYKALPKTPLTDPSVYFQPGALACPDRDDDGDADCILPNTASLIGRVPFKTIGLDDLRDASGERLWYALSHDFRKLRCTGGTVPPDCTVINSDTQGQLTVVGIAPASQVVAVLFAPGEALQGQNRDPDPTTAAHNDPLNYLEGPPNLDPTNHVNYVFTTASPSATFNDRVLTITRAELMDAVEPVVAANIERDVKPLLGEYFTAWGRYPFAVPFVSPPTAQSAYLGVSPQTRGLLPVTNGETFAWTNATVTQIGNFAWDPTYPSVVSSASCSISSLSVTCVVNYDAPPTKDDHNARPIIKLEVFLSPNVNLAFANLSSPPTPPGDIPFVMRQGDGNLAQYSGPPWGYWSFSGPPPTMSFVGSTLTYTGWLHDANQNGHQANITFPLPAVGYLPRLTNPSTTSPNIAWFIANQWYRQTYYAVSPGWVPSGVGGCNPPPGAAPLCLTVNNLPGPNNKQAILVFAGRALDGQNPHPTGNVGDYLEGENSTPADLIFEHRAGPSPTINDRVVVIAP